MEEINERELLKSTSDIFMRVCSVCGNKFYSKKDVKLCRKCNYERRKTLAFTYKITNEEFKILHEKFKRKIKRVILIFISYDSIYFDLIEEQVLVTLWIEWLRMKEKGFTFEELKETKNYIIYWVVKRSYINVIHSKDLPYNISGSRGIREHEKEALRLDEPKFRSTEEKLNSLIDVIANTDIPVDKHFDLKTLVKKIMMESVFDSDIKAAIVRAELTDLNIKTASIEEEDKVKLINEQYNLPIKSLKELKSKAQDGIYKLYNAYAPEIKDVLEIADKDFKIDTNGKEVAKHFITNPLKKCVVCGKAFLSNKPYEIVCSPNCAAIRANEKKKEKRKKDKLKELSNSVFMATSLDETKKNLSEILKLIDEIN